MSAHHPSRPHPLPRAIAWGCAGVPLASIAVAAPRDVTRARWLMGTMFTASAAARDSADAARVGAALDAALDEVAALERTLSNWSATSELCRLNDTGASAAASEPLRAVVDSALAWAAITGGAFDPTVEPLVRAYDLRGTGRLPDARTLADARARVGYTRVARDGDAIALHGAALDLGGIAKGFALDRAAAVLAARQVRDAVLDAGGQRSSDASGSAWVADPHDRDRAAVRVRLAAGSLATSVQRERGLVMRGKRVGHVLDPRDGEPVPGEASVSVAAASGTRADALSTALLVLGRTAAHAFASAHPDIGVLWLSPPCMAWTLTPGTSRSIRSRVMCASSQRTRGRRAPTEPVTHSMRMIVNMNRYSLRTLAAALLVATLPHAALAQTTPSAPIDDARLTDIEKKLDAALAEIEQLKLGSAASDTTPAYASRHGFAPAASRVYNVASGPSIGGYGEMIFDKSDRTREDGTLSGAGAHADLLRTVFYIGHKFSSSLLFNSEIEFEHSGVKDEAEVGVDLGSGQGEAELSGEATMEFAYLDWQFHQRLGVRAGKLLVPVGLVNEQHEPPVFPGARRPETESVVIPSTWSAAGAGFYGETAQGLEWRAYVVEGLDASHFDAARAIREGRQGASQSRFTHPAFTARLDYKGSAGLVLGVSGFTGDAWQQDQPAGAALSNRVSLADAHVRWQWHGLELRGLYATGTLSQAGALSDALALTGADRLGKRFAGGYAEAMFDVAPRLWPGTSYVLAPYVRAETLDTQEGVDGGTNDPALERTITTFGLAAKPHPNVVVKLDREQRSNKANTETSRWNVALGWLF